MLDEDKSPKDILFQFKAVESALQKAYHLLLDEVYRKSFPIQIINTLDTCPSDSGNEERFEAFRKKIPDLKLEKLAHKM